MIAITLLVEPILLGKPQWSPDSIRSNLAYLAQRLMQPKELCHPLSVRHECNFVKSSDECLAVAAVRLNVKFFNLWSLAQGQGRKGTSS